MDGLTGQIIIIVILIILSGYFSATEPDPHEKPGR